MKLKSDFNRNSLDLKHLNIHIGFLKRNEFFKTCSNMITSLK